jgi:hypothetical protein
MILFFDFERLLYGQTIGDIGPAARLAKVLMPYPQVDLVLTRWRIGAMRSIKDVRGEVPELGGRGAELGCTGLHRAGNPLGCAADPVPLRFR